MTKQLLLVSLSVAWVAALLCVTLVLSAGECDPDCTGKNPQDQVMNPLDCTKYYVCLGDGIVSDVSLDCPSGQLFEPAAPMPGCAVPVKPGVCTWAECVPQTCRLTCTKVPDMIVDKNDCSRYYSCEDDSNVQGPFNCPAATPYFDGQNQVCVSNPAVCCDLCIAYCPPYLAEIPDPYDCNKYYLCLTAGKVDQAYHYTCPSGETFDPTAGQCVPSDVCTPLCGVNSYYQDSMTCMSVGFFPKYKTCEKEYFQCQTVGQPGIVGACVDGKVFNTDPAYPYCIPPEDCPYHPQL